MATLNEASLIVIVSHGATPDVYGAYVPLIASAVRDSTWATFFGRPIPTHGTFFSFDIAIGPPGQEVNIVTEFTNLTIGSGTDWNDSYMNVSLPLKVSTGDRVSARVKGSASFGVSFSTQIRLFE